MSRGILEFPLVALKVGKNPPALDQGRFKKYNTICRRANGKLARLLLDLKSQKQEVRGRFGNSSVRDLTDLTDGCLGKKSIDFRF